MKSNTLNTILAISALVVSISALYISVQEMRIMRSQQKATMYPYITIGQHFDDKGFGIILKNSGNGLARVTSYRIAYEGDYIKEWDDCFKYIEPIAKNVNYNVFRTAGNLRDRMITPNEKLNIIMLEWNEETRKLQKFMGDLKVYLCYSSLLGEHWEVIEGIPQTIGEPCPIIPEQEFEFAQ